MSARWVFGLLGLAIGSLLVAAAGWATGRLTLPDVWMHGPPRPVLPLTFDVAGVSFQVAPAFVRNPAQRQSGPRDRVDLWLRHPGLEAPAPMVRPEPGVVRQDATGTDDVVFLAITRLDAEAPSPERRASELYGRFVERGAWSNPGGLIMRRFTADSPYQDEDLFLSPPDGSRFTARCRRPAPAVDMLPETCLWLIRQPPWDIQVRFSPALLADWIALDASVIRFIRDLRPNG